jgi:hypothetical protein
MTPMAAKKTLRPTPVAGAVVCIIIVAGCCAGCGASNGTRDGFDGDDPRLDPALATPDAAYRAARDAAPRTLRYAFYPGITPNYLRHIAHAWNPRRAFLSAADNTQGRLSVVLGQAELAVYVTAEGEVVTPEDFEMYARFRDDPDDAEARRELEERARRDAEIDPWGATAAPPAPLPRPTELVGVVCMFGGVGRTLAMAVWREPAARRITASEVWYLAFDGRYGDRAYYRLSDSGRLIIHTAARDVGRLTGP